MQPTFRLSIGGLTYPATVSLWLDGIAIFANLPGSHLFMQSVPDQSESKAAKSAYTAIGGTTCNSTLGSVDVYRRRMTVAAIAMKAEKLLSVLQHRVAIPLYSFSFPKKFSIRCRHL